MPARYSSFLPTIALSILIFSACNGNNSSVNSNDSSINSNMNNTDTADSRLSLTPSNPKPSWAPQIKDEMQVVMDKLGSYGASPIETLTVQEARQQPTPTTAVMDVMKEKSIPMPPSMVDTTGKDIPVKGGSIHARIYTPKDNKGPFPVIVYYHGGGWVIADLNTYDASAKGLAEQTNAIVVSVHYRQGPEYKFPTAHNDAFAAYQWVLKNASSMNGDPRKVAVAGESAGGNLAANVSIMARNQKIMIPLYQVLIYPVANNDMNSESYLKNAQAKPLNKPMMEWFAKNYLSSMSTSADPRISLVTANLKGLPPTTIIAAEIDPLLTEGKMLADKLQEAGVKVNYMLYEGVTHEFFGMAAIVPEAKDAQSIASADFKEAFNK